MSVLYLIEQESPFHKLLIDLQMEIGIKFGTTDKINDNACAEMAVIIGDVLSDIVKEYTERFMSISCAASEARKTSEEKELVYAKILHVLT